MGIRYLFSGFDNIEGFSEEVAEYLRADITETELLLFIASSPDFPEKTDQYLYVNENWFKKIGLVFDEVAVIDNRISAEASKELIERASCVVLMGGNTLEQIEFIRNYHLVRNLKNSKAVVSGISAGAINMGVMSLCSKDEDSATTIVYKGLGLVDLTAEPHFSADKTEFILQELYPISNRFPIFGICDGAAIRVENDGIQFIGEIYVIENEVMTCCKLAEI